MEKHVVIVYPHPDDESFGAAGTITKLRNENIDIINIYKVVGYK